MSKAIVYLWPRMSKPAMQEEEGKLVEAGYTEKAALPISNRWLSDSKQAPLKVWRIT